MTLEEATKLVLVQAVALTAMVYPAVLIVKQSAQLRGWSVTAIALALCALCSWGFWSWDAKHLIVVNVFAIILGFGGATGVDRGVDKVSGK